MEEPMAASAGPGPEPLPAELPAQLPVGVPVGLPVGLPTGFPAPEQEEWTLRTCFHLSLSVLGWFFLTSIFLEVLFLLLPFRAVRWMGSVTLLGLDSIWFLVLRQYRWRSGVKPLWRGPELRSVRAWLLVAAGLLLCLGADAARILFLQQTRAYSFWSDMAALAHRGAPIAWGPIALLFLGTVVLAPVVEEWSFRGILQGALTRRWGPWVAIPVTAVVFGLLHGPASAPVVTGYGLVFGVLAHKRQSLTLPMLVHGGINLAVLGIPVLVEVLGR